MRREWRGIAVAGALVIALVLLANGPLGTWEPVQLHKCRSLGYTSGYMAARVSVDPDTRQIKWSGKTDQAIWKRVSWAFAGPAAYPSFKEPPGWALDCLERGGAAFYVYFRYSGSWTIQAARYCIQDSNHDGWYTTPLVWINVRNFGERQVDACAYVWVRG